MGCDIHVYPEYLSQDFTEGEFNVWPLGEYDGIGRDYTLFGVLAGVRSSAQPITHPKGLPDALGYVAESKYHLRVYPDDEANKYSEENSTCHSRAAEWLKSGSSKLIEEDKETGVMKITHPDWHSVSWLTLDELFLARRLYIQEQLVELPKRQQSKYNKILKNITSNKQLFNHSFGNLESLGLNGLIGMLLAVERTIGDKEKGYARVVFWFDS